MAIILNPKFDDALVNIPKQAPLTHRICDVVQNILHRVFPQYFETALEKRAFELSAVIGRLRESGECEQALMQKYNVKAADFLSDFRTSLQNISSIDQDKRFGEALEIFSRSLHEINRYAMFNKDNLYFYQNIISTFYDEFFAFAAQCYKYEVVKTGAFKNIRFVYPYISELMRMYTTVPPLDEREVQERFCAALMTQLPSVDKLVQHKVESILKKDPSVQRKVKVLNQEILKLLDEKEAFKGKKSQHAEIQKNKIDAELCELRKQRGELLEHLHVTDQVNEYRLNLVSIGVVLDPKSFHHNQLQYLAQKNGYSTYNEMIELHLIAQLRDQLQPIKRMNFAQSPGKTAADDTKTKQTTVQPSANDLIKRTGDFLKVEFQTSSYVIFLDEKVKQLIQDIERLDRNFFENKSDAADKISLVEKQLFEYIKIKKENLVINAPKY